MGMADYRRSNRRSIFLTAGIVLVAVVVAVYSISVSKYDLGFVESLGIVWDNICGIEFGTYEERLKSFLVWDGYVPMVIGGILVGAILGVG